MKQDFQEDAEETIRTTVHSLQTKLPKLIIDLPSLKRSALEQGGTNKPITYFQNKPEGSLKCVLQLREYINNLPAALRAELAAFVPPLSVFLYHELRLRHNKEVYIDFLANVVKNGILASPDEVDNQQYFNTKHVLVMSRFGYDHLVDFVVQQEWLSVLSIINKHFVIDIKHDVAPKATPQNPKTPLQKACDTVNYGIGMSSFSFIKSFKVSNNTDILCMKVSSDNKVLLASSANSIVYKWDLTECRDTPCTPHDVKLYSDDEFTIEVAPSDQKCVELRGHTAPVYCVDIHVQSGHALSGSYDATVILWDLHSNRALCKYEGHSRWPVYCVRFSPVSPFFCTTSHDTTARLWRTDKLESLRIFCGHDAPVTCAAFHPNGSYVFAGSEDKSCRMWDVTSGACVRVMANKAHITSLAISPNGRLVSCTLRCGNIVLWDIATTKIVRHYSVASNPTANGYHSNQAVCNENIMNCSAFLHNNTLATGDTYGNIMLWDTRLHSKLHIKPIKHIQVAGKVQTLSNSVAGLLVVGLSL